ncbi:acetolactate synthase large subunit [Bombilactobacillus folatiphilus]|uniref:Acetolactate synthase large subunit n=1 Tax=Bombilactobacillus folatiphilus TaxID=2923362 RepID=A0ABY4P8F3_9LACO|nr:acetolactate synthase large subunit [Bombilactobacillus folatiphilus]UQS81804.1 acetolactate synthase large subunit [Bombilactobacillus folatiphilus]
MNIAQQIVQILEDRGVKYVFGIPGEENIRIVDAIHDSDKIQFILVRHEQGASFMADVYGRLTGQPGVATATLGPGAINLLLGVADAKTNSTPLIAITAQGGLNRIYKESHQVIDLRAMFQPVTKWSENVYAANATPEIVNKAFNQAVNGRPGPVYLGIPQDIEPMPAVPAIAKTASTPANLTVPQTPDLQRAAQIIKKAQHPIALIGMGVIRDHASEEVNNFIKQTNLPAATTFMGKGAIDDRLPSSLGVIGFMRHDYENFAYDQADVILTIGYELSEFDPNRINPDGDKQIIHLNDFQEDTDAHYTVSQNLIGNLQATVPLLQEQLSDFQAQDLKPAIKDAVQAELTTGQQESQVPLTPQQIVTATREAVDDQGIVLVDTGALKMWMARLYQTYTPNSALIDNGLSTMSWTLPGAIGAKLACPDKNILAVMGDGSFMMNSQELETAVRYHVPMTNLVWVDQAYGLIKWKMDMEMEHHSEVDFHNPDLISYAKSFGANAHMVQSRADLVQTLKTSLTNQQVNVIICPVDYSENMKLINKLGKVTISL